MIESKDFEKVKELFEAASNILPDIVDVPARDRLARALTAFSNSYMFVEDEVVCDHPEEAIKFNEFNKVTQCHKCGQIFPVDGPDVDPKTGDERETFNLDTKD